MCPPNDMADDDRGRSGQGLDDLRYASDSRPYWRLEALNDLSGRLLEGGDPDREVLPALFESIGFGIDCLYSYRVTPLGDRLELAYSDGELGGDCPRHPRRVRFGQGVAGIVAATHEAFHVTDIQVRAPDQSDALGSELLRNARLTAYACEPIAVSGRLFGVVCFASRSLARFTAADLVLFQAVARHVALAHDRAERLRDLEHCNRELQHRVNNALSTVHAIALLSSRSTTNPQEFVALFGERLAALARTQNILTHQGQSARLRDLLCSELKPYDSAGRVRMHGPSVRLPASLAIYLGIAVHELTVNSAQHGALGAEHGNLRLMWSIRSDGLRNRLVIDWREMGGPPVQLPVRRGFGSRLLDGGIGRQIRYRREFLPDGLQVTLEVVLD